MIRAGDAMMWMRADRTSSRCVVLLASLLLASLPAVAASPATPVGNEFQVNAHTYAFQGLMSAAADPTGDFVIVWLSNGQDGSDSGVFGQRFDSSGVRSG